MKSCLNCVILWKTDNDEHVYLGNAKVVSWEWGHFGIAVIQASEVDTMDKLDALGDDHDWDTTYQLELRVHSHGRLDFYDGSALVAKMTHCHITDKRFLGPFGVPGEHSPLTIQITVHGKVTTDWQILANIQGQE